MWATQVNFTCIAHIYRLCLTFARKLKKPVFCAKAGPRTLPENVDITAVGKNNACLNARAATFARSTVVKSIGRSHLDLFHLERLISPNIDLHMKLMPSPNNFVCNYAAPCQGAQQENFKLVIQSVNLIIRTKKITSTSHGALMDLSVKQNMRHHLLRV